MLFVVMLGGRHPRARIEIHDVAFVIGDNLKSTYPQLRESWFGSPDGLHIDSWLEVDGVEAYRVEFSEAMPAPGEQRLFFVNLGGYELGSFGEAHQYVLVAARDAADAKVRAKRRMPRSWDKAHTDAVIDVDDCIAIDQVGGRYVHLVEGESRGIVQRSDYIVL
ncbi:MULTISPECIES: DUF1543 domain-containing protein [Pseudomonadaceae]|uniref:DUF1543 domain-containing protein n=1 Tax=Pseudomonas denitrificans TaxID=43306 RepID=A0A9X7MY07_PSEDE|nr:MULTISPECIES: DUF1543 domain-containing protein [Pseudomonadaceae]OQR36147.1 hypothetical protein BWR15_07420 [Pseudomonas sp. T]MBD9516426.1 DUF1543 domain-containing protein [Pseudomonas sp. PDM22]MBD9628936.1 DUF1543 domain-containing protein [Pseudomonas sp. PDM19]MBD9684813.1 DUF1543 domain-containing protein [Pseudomonas sp. PDM20]QEY71126.1 DUF1543 domain-containing protein [Pseudomonas denitrificans (nom. rej.)]